MDLTGWPKKLFIIIALIGCFTCYARPDYNLPLFAFAYLLWDIEKPASQKTRLIYLFIFSWIIDFVWLVYWGPFWDSSIFKNNWAQGVQTFVLTLSVIEFLIKLVTIIVCVFAERECYQALHPDNVVSHARNLLNAPPSTQPGLQPTH